MPQSDFTGSTREASTSIPARQPNNPIRRPAIGQSHLLNRALAGLAMLLVAPTTGVAQEFDAFVSSTSRKPATILDEIDNPAERAAFRALYDSANTKERLSLAETFVSTFPQSWLLAQAYEVAAKAAIEAGDYDRALRDAASSLRILPENPVLMVSVANVQAQKGLAADAARNARDALEDLDRFARPASIDDQAWPEIERRLRASCYFALGRATVSEGLAAPSSEDRNRLLRQAVSDLSQAASLNPGDSEVFYLAGLAYLSLGDRAGAASQFAAARARGGELQSKAEDQLKKLYEFGAKNVN